MRMCAVIPVYQHVQTTGAVLDALVAHDIPCIVVDDGNSGPDAAVLRDAASQRQNVEVLRLPVNGGKGVAVQTGLLAAGAAGYSHALQIDADGQHDVRDIGSFITLAHQHPDEMIYGVPVYDDSVPRSRLYGRYLTHAWVWINTWSLDIRDSMCGFRVYPLAQTLPLLKKALPPRMDFDSEVMVRLHWRGVKFREVRSRVMYPEGGRSHFRMLRDNVRITWMHTRLFFGMLLRSPMLIARRLGIGAASGAHWASLGENTWVGGISLLLLIYRLAGRWPFRVAVFPVVLANWLLRPATRHASLDYLRRIDSRRADVPVPGIRRSLAHVMHFAETILDKLLAAGGKYPVAKVRIEGREEFYAAAAQGGVIIVTAHMGCLELCQHMAEARGSVRLNVLVHTRHAEKFNGILRRLNPGTQARFMEVTSFDTALAMRLAQRVAAGECVVIAGDRVPVAGGASTTASFLGAPAHFPIGPYVLAGAFRCPLFFLCCIREGGGYTIHFRRLADRVTLDRKERAARLAGHAAIYARALEEMLLRSPLDWFNFFDFWKQGRNHESRT